MESSATMFGVPFRKAPRPGQLEAIERAAEPGRTLLNVQQPTGYGKTFTAAAIYSVKRQQGHVNRLLYVVGTEQQRTQFRMDGPADFRDAGVPIRHIVDITFSNVAAMQANRRNTAEVFCITVQSMLENSGGAKTVAALMETGRWMVCVDEMHHYGEDKAFARAVLQLPAVFVLAMSATPHRRGRDGIFGEPDVVIRYGEAANQKCVKFLNLHSYLYRVDTINQDGDICSYTTDELAAAFGLTPGPNGELTELDKQMIKRNLRWSPKYVSPLVEIPITRAVRTSLRHGTPPQVLIRAMSVSHAKLVHNQVTSMFSDLVVEWVGTGEDGKTSEENRRIIEGFCPSKNNETGQRRPEDVTVNVLIAVGLAGEGMDSTYVTEVVFLTPANDTNQNRQAIGRASRIIGGEAIEQPVGNVNVDSSSQLAQYRGQAIMALLDAPVGEAPAPEEQPKDDDDRLDELPDEPVFLILDALLLNIDSAEVREAGAQLQQMNIDFHMEIVDWQSLSEDDPRFLKVLNGLREVRRREAEQLNEQSMVERWRKSVMAAATAVTGNAIRQYKHNGARVDKTLAGDLKTKINQQKARECGVLQMDVESLKRHYKWLTALNSAIVQGRLPTWLQ